MSVLEVVNYGDPILRKKCQPVSDFSKLPAFVEDMFDTMYEEEGIGLAANQVGVDMNLFIIDIAHTDEKEFPRIFINGEITKSYGESVFSEGCLSIPQVALEVTRPEKIRFKYQDMKKTMVWGRIWWLIGTRYSTWNGPLKWSFNYWSS